MRLYWGESHDPKVLYRVARVVILDRETSAESEAWRSLTRWEQRHYATCAAEDLRRQGRLP
jgi:hypothetical protein